MTMDILALLNKNPLELGPAKIPLNKQDYQHWILAWDSDDLAWLLLDRNGHSANSLDTEVLEELDRILAILEQQPPKALVLRSAKTGGFCVGADISMFRGLDDSDTALQKLRSAHDIVDRLANLSCTTIAVIHGACLGGGLELALACNHRIAISNARLGFPEVLLGLHPGLGGTFRTPALINPIDAMTLMLTGKTVPAKKARALGLVDAVTEERHVATAVAAAAQGQLKKTVQTAYHRLLSSDPGRKIIASQMRRKTAARVNRKHYPAPFRLIELWQRFGGDPKKAQQQEIRSFAELVVSPAGQNLVRVFFLREMLKPKAPDFAGGKLRRIHVIGAGTMGGDIAGWCAFNGLTVTLEDQKAEIIASAINRARQLCQRKYRSEAETRAVLDRLMPDPDGIGQRQADLIIEAVPENIEIKRSVYQKVQSHMKPGALLATNTSSIPLEILREHIADPGRFFGLHFFNPVAQMPLVEVVSHDQLSATTIEQANNLLGLIDRLPVQVRSAPGFLVNRILTPYLLEAILMVDEGLSPETIDQAALDFGMPMGPLELADRVGLDICVTVADMLRDQLDNAAAPPVPRWLRDKVASGETGRKTNQGIYHWQDNKPKKQPSAIPPPDCIDRLILPILNTSIACLRENVVSHEDRLDAAIIFGTGFAPFRGGPLHYARERGVHNILSQLDLLAKEYGARFNPDQGWQTFDEDKQW